MVCHSRLQAVGDSFTLRMTPRRSVRNPRLTPVVSKFVGDEVTSRSGEALLTSCPTAKSGVALRFPPQSKTVWICRKTFVISRASWTAVASPTRHRFRTAERVRLSQPSEKTARQMAKNGWRKIIPDIFRHPFFAMKIFRGSFGDALRSEFRLQAVQRVLRPNRLKAELLTLSLANKIITTTSPACAGAGRC